MATYLVTGSTGFIGSALCKALAEKGHSVKAFCRNSQKAEELFSHANIEIVLGDIADSTSLEGGLMGCDGVFHLAAYAKLWSKNPKAFYEINVGGTRNLLNACVSAGVKRVVITSTAGIYGPALNGVVNENSIPAIEPITEYERTKQLADEKAKTYLDRLHISWVHPTRVFGPGELTESNSVTKLIKMRSAGKLTPLPGNGRQSGNYVFVDDVVSGEILAMEKGASGEHYILGSDNLSYRQFYELIDDLDNQKRIMLPLPLWLMKAFAFVQLVGASIFGSPPLMTPEFLRKYTYHWSLDINKAKTELGFAPIPVKAGIEKTLHWLATQKRDTPL